MEITDSLQKAEIPFQTFTLNIDSPFPPLNEVIKQFYEKNGLLIPKEEDIISTHGGNMYRTDEGLLLFTQYVTSNGRNLDILERHHYERQISPMIGGSGGSTHRERTYEASGKLKGENIHLTAIASEDQRFNWIESNNIEERGYKKEGEPSFHIRRKDNLPYWFVTDAKTN